MSLFYMGVLLITNGMFLLYLWMFHHPKKTPAKSDRKRDITPLDVCFYLFGGGLAIIYRDATIKPQDQMLADFISAAKYGNLYFFFLGCFILLAGNFLLEILTAIGFTFETDASDKRFIAFGVILTLIGAASYFGL